MEDQHYKVLPRYKFYLWGTPILLHTIFGTGAGSNYVRRKPIPGELSHVLQGLSHVEHFTFQCPTNPNYGKGTSGGQARNYRLLLKFLIFETLVVAFLLET